MRTENNEQEVENYTRKIGEIAASCLKLGIIGFGGIAGMVATIENEMVVRRKWIDHKHFMDVLSTSYIIPGLNAVEVVAEIFMATNHYNPAAAQPFHSYCFDYRQQKKAEHSKFQKSHLHLFHLFITFA